MALHFFFQGLPWLNLTRSQGKAAWMMQFIKVSISGSQAWLRRVGRGPEGVSRIYPTQRHPVEAAVSSRPQKELAMLVHEHARATFGAPRNSPGGQVLCGSRGKEELKKQGHECDLICPYDTWENSHTLLLRPSSSKVGSGGRMPWLQGQVRSRKIHFALETSSFLVLLLSTATSVKCGFLLVFHICNTAMQF